MARRQRRYSDDERAAALAALAANANNLSRTSKELGIPVATLESWSKRKTHPEASENSEAKKGPLADHLEAIAWKLADSMPDKLKDAELRDVAVSLGVIVDKMQLLRGRPTDITKNDPTGLSDDEIRDRIEEIRRRRAALGRGAAAS